MTRARSSSARVFQAIESLELRQMLAADLPSVDYHGHAVAARPGQWIVELSGLKGAGQGKQLKGANDRLTGLGLKATRHLGSDGLFLVESAKDKKFADVENLLKKVGGFKFAEPDFTLSVAGMPNDTYAGYEWGLNNTGQSINGVAGTPDADIDAPEAWSLFDGSGAAKVVTGVIDSGVDYTHPDLAANVWTNPGEVAGNGVDDDGNGYVDDIHGYDFYANDADPMDENGHGTHVAGTIAATANNGTGVAGVNYNGQVMALRFLGPDGSGDTAGALSAINYANKMRTQYGVNVRVLNNSWGGGGFSQSIADAIAASNNAGILFVAAAGNGGSDNIGDNNDSTANYPSNYTAANVVAVAATNNKDQLASFSNYGATTVDLAAPGFDIASTYPGNSYVWMSGTSMATPHVAGAASLAFAYNPNATVAQVKQALMDGTDKVASLTGKTVTGGRLNLLNTLQKIAPTTTTNPTPTITAPAAPSNFTATAASSSQINLAWGDVATETGYRVERKNSDGSYTSVATLGQNATSYSVTGLAASTAYTFRVVATNTAGSTPSADATATTQAAAPIVTTGDGLAATYFDNKDFTGKTVTRVDSAVNFNWGTAAPISGFGADTFSVRWTGYVQPQYSQTYTFYTTTDDGVRLWVNGQLLINKWTSQSAKEYKGSITLTGGQKYAIKMEYYDNTGNASAKLSWSSPSVAKQVIPQSRLFSGTTAAAAAPATASAASVFSDRALAGGSASDLLKDDAAVLS
jgi:subtilisin family serine protease